MSNALEVRWCAKAYQGRFLDSDEVPYISELRGVFAPLLKDRNEKCIRRVIIDAVRVELKKTVRAGIPIDSDAIVAPFMTVSVEQVVEDTDGRSVMVAVIARLQMVNDGRLVHGNIWIEGTGFVELESTYLVNGDGIWEIAARILGPLHRPDLVLCKEAQ
ncbi:hypothetical protein H3V53_03430 [Paraburkholderia bengalensis]|uniref:Tim44-like domain-containing protein n=1 Tax=Paraburkholderia bengalensis TaxID=2747562 RepID=A0ABU8IL18_9BURK